MANCFSGSEMTLSEGRGVRGVGGAFHFAEVQSAFYP